MKESPHIIRGKKTVSAFVLITGMLAPVSPSTAQTDLVVGDFKASDLTNWEEKSFIGKTKYNFVKTEIGTALKAESKASASGLFKEMTIDLTKTPCLNWSWKIDAVLGGLDETTKQGDDYPARVYVVFSGGVSFWKTRALNYVWSNGRDRGSSWPNAYTDRSINIAAQSGTGKVGQWVHQSHNIREDYLRLVGKDTLQADAVAIMTDTDNSGKAATAYYGDIKFTPSC